MLSVNELSIVHHKDLRELVRKLSFSVSGSDRLALIGEEGNGKSTLLKAICDPSGVAGYCTVTGHISASGEKMGYLPQEIAFAKREMPVYEFCQAESAFLDCPPKLLNGLCAKVRLNPEICYADCAVKALSGGEKVKLQLLLALCAEPTMLLLDEPSNDLDLSTLRFLEQFICECGLPVIYISHDETLLSRTATRVLHLEQAYHKQEPRWTLANVPYDVYMEQRGRALAQQERQAQMERRQERARQEKFDRIYQAVDAAQENISRGDPHGARLLKKKMKAVKSLEKRFEREREDATQRPNIEYAMDASFQGDHGLPAGKRVLDFTLPELRAGGRVLAQNISLRMTGPEKVLIIGENGCGKTTLMHWLCGRMQERSDVRFMWMPQRYEEALDEEKTAIDFLHTRGDKEQLTQIRLYLGAFKFTREEMMHPISALSGGQKAKLLWLRILLSDANVLLLDEPTRNLSPLSAPVVRELMRSFDGALLAITHDRMLISSWPGRVLRMTPSGLVQLQQADMEAL